MEWLIPAFVMGLLGSLHCAGMCGPLLFALPASGSRAKWLRYKLAHQTGRLLTYGILGGILALVGQGVFIAGWQQSLSVLTGIFLLFLAIWPYRTEKWVSNSLPIKTITASLQQRLKPIIGKGGIYAHFSFGLVNGLLPCGLVYVALSGAMLSGSFVNGMGWMMLFGLGTLPMLLGILLVGNSLPKKINLRHAMPIAAASIGLLLVVRGLGLGIPYLSPILERITYTLIPSCH